MRQYLAGVAAGESASATNYVPLAAGNLSSGYVTTEAQVACPFPCDAVVQSFRVFLVTAPGTSKSRQFTIFKNGFSTGLTVTISGGTTSATITTPVLFAAGDLISVQNIPSGSPAASVASWRCQVDTPMARQAILMGGTTSSSTYAANTNEYAHIGGHNGGSVGYDATEANTGYPVPCPGVITAVAAHTTVAPGAFASGRNYEYGVTQNGTLVAAGLVLETQTVTVTPVLSTRYAAGDTISQYFLKSTSSASGVWTWSAVFQPDDDGYSFFGYSNVNAPDVTNATEYMLPYGTGRSVMNPTEANLNNFAPGPVTLKALYAVRASGPGTAHTWTLTLRSNLADTTLSVALGGSFTTVFDTDPGVVLADGDTLCFSDVLSVSGTASAVRVGVLTYVKPLVIAGGLLPILV